MSQGNQVFYCSKCHAWIHVVSRGDFLRHVISGHMKPGEAIGEKL